MSRANLTSARGDTAPIINRSDASLDAGVATEQLWKQFKESTVPRLKDIETQIAGRQDDFIAEATDSANKASEMAIRQSELSREALGIQLNTVDQESTDRLGVLSSSMAGISAKNEAVSVADDVNTNQAAALTSVQTGLTQDAIANLQGAANLEDSRKAGDSARRTAASSQNLQTVGTTAMLALAFM
jgi:hypothetical protein